MIWPWIVGLYVGGIFVWCVVCGYRRDEVGAALAPFWPVCVPLMAMEQLGGLIRDLVDRRRT